MSNISIEEKRAEAAKRMKALGILKETIEQFICDGLVSVCEPPFGAFYWVEGEEADAIKKFEQEHDALVYMVVRSYFEDIGEMDSYLFVGDNKDEWEYEHEDLKSGIVFTYTINYSMHEFSEFGFIGVKRTVAAGLVRTC